MRLSAWVERLLIAIGCGCLVAVGIGLLEAASFQKMASRTFERELVTPAPLTPAPLTPAPPELSDNLSAPVMPVARGLIGRLEIPRLNVSVIVMEGDDDATLARAVGHLPDTALPWEQGNAVIAGHRDTFFRPLRNVREGDEMRMTTARGTFDYRVMSTRIVEPNDLSVLAPTAIRSLTLVTCYPFNYVGSAPQRFIIHARSGFPAETVLARPRPRALHASLCRCYHDVTIMKAKTMVYLERDQLEALRARARAERISLAEAVRRAVRMSLDAGAPRRQVPASAYRELVAIGTSGHKDIASDHDRRLASALRAGRRAR